MSEQTYECARCGHSYTGRYGKWVEQEEPMAAYWYCHECLADRSV